MSANQDQPGTSPSPDQGAARPSARSSGNPPPASSGQNVPGPARPDRKLLNGTDVQGLADTSPGAPERFPAPDSAPEPDGNALSNGLRTRLRRFFAATVFSSLTRRIVFLNLAALLTLVGGILFLNQMRDGLIDARVQSLRVQGEIISAAIAASATVDSNVISVNPDRLLEFQSDVSVSPLSFFDPALEFPISPERVAPLLRNLITPTRTRARIYDKSGFLLLDSNSIYISGEVIRPPAAPQEKPPLLVELWNRLLTWVPGDEFPPYVEHSPSEGKNYPEVAAALSGAPTDIVRVDHEGKLLISVAVPVQRQRATVGALLLSTDPGEIDAIIAAERLGVLRLALGALVVSTLLSFFLAGTIAEPVRRLSSAAKRVQKSMSARDEIPDYSDRSDEIGDLSRSVRAMTGALFDRIEAIERFAADVAHELKNPLTSLRSAVETLPRVNRREDRERLQAIILHDVQRLDRLISDISNASRLDAELARDATQSVDMEKVCIAMVSMHADLAAKQGVNVVFEKDTDGPVPVSGHDSRLAQVVSNLIDNAVSFSPRGGTVHVSLTVRASQVILLVSDEGPGIKGEPEEIFRRFYTDRPEQEDFGNHSGLGLSISKQIIEAHGGTISARNRSENGAGGAQFRVVLPALQS